MKTLPVLIAAALVAGSAFARAQEPAPAVSAPPTQPNEQGMALPLDGADLLPSLPAGPNLLTLPSVAPTAPSPADAAPQTSAPTPPAIPSPALTKGTAEQLRQAIRIRELKTVALEDPQVQAQREGARCAQTNAGRCVWMRNYYTLLYTKIETLDPSLHDVVEEQLHGLLERFEQHKIRPSVLIEDVEELPGSHSADHPLAGGKPAKSAGHPSKKKPKKKTLGS